MPGTSQVNMTSILASLPTVGMAFPTIGIMKLTGQFAPDEIYLGDTPSWMFG